MHSNARPGESNGLARLSLKEVERIRDLYSEGLYSYADLGKRFNVSRHTISSLLTGRSWQGQGGVTTKQTEQLAKVRDRRRNHRWQHRRDHNGR
jgi:hypothetical protein